MSLLLVGPSFFLTLLLILHAVRVRGAKTALGFFLFSFLFGVIRGNSVAILATGENNGPYIFSHAWLSVGRAEVPACVGWVFALYLSWTLAEGVLSRRESSAGRVFPLGAFVILAMGCFAYAVETTASGVGWWRWNIVRRSTPFLVGGTHLFGIVEWMSVGLDFLVPFLLFRTDRRARSPLAWGSLLLYPLHWVSHWKPSLGAGLPLAYEIYHALVVFAVMVFPLLSGPRLSPAPAAPAPRWIRSLPAAAVLGMFAVLAVADLGILKEPALLVSILPLALFLGISLAGEVALPALTVVGALLAAVLSLTSGAGMVSLARVIPVLLPAACVLVFGGGWDLTSAGRKRALYASAVILLAVVSGAGMIRGKRVREEYARLVEEAHSKIRSGDFAGAESSLLRAIDLKPNVTLGMKELVNLYGGRGRLDEAWRYASRSLEVDPTDWEAYRLAAQVRKAKGDLDAAIRLYERVLMLNPREMESVKALAAGYAEKGRYDDAIRILRNALLVNPQDPELYHLLGALLIQTRDFPEARRVVSRALEIAPEDPASHLLMAFVLAGVGDAAAARAECEQVLRIRPEDPQARSLLESLPK